MRCPGLRQGARRLLVGTSYGGGAIPQGNVVRVSDFLLLHGNGVSDPERIAAMVEQTRRLPESRPLPILFNEDDHFNWGINTERKRVFFNLVKEVTGS